MPNGGYYGFDVTGDILDPGGNVPDISDESWWVYIERGFDTLDTFTDLLKDWGILDGSRTRAEESRIQDWIKRNIYDPAGQSTASQLMPTILLIGAGIAVLILVVTLVRR